jgi:endo-1,4-beta-D-glucanase Y
MQSVKRVLASLILVPLSITFSSAAQQPDTHLYPAIGAATAHPPAGASTHPPAGAAAYPPATASTRTAAGTATAMTSHPLADLPIPLRPFPQHNPYQQGTILPNHISQEEMDDSVKSFYLAWKKHYVLPGCRQGEKYIWFEGTKGTNICVSEGQGYGMVIVALMAGYDSTAQETYDCLFRWYKSHPSTTSPYLMAWMQKKDCSSLDGGSATDGDMDIAYSLLLADAQWGRHSNIPYRQEALAMTGAILHQEINPQTYIVMEDNSGRPRNKDYFDMRSSDYMPDHLRAFREATENPAWDTVLDNNYRLFRYLQNTYSPDAGLVPDFIKNIRISPSRVSAAPGQPTTPGQPTSTGRKTDTSSLTGKGSNTPAPPPDSTALTGTGPAPSIEQDADDANFFAQPVQPNYLESKYDGVYNFNACRVPWHIATDYLVSGDPRAAAFLSRINHWIQTTTKGNPDNISAGYNLSGEDLPHRYFEALCFICPFAVAAMASPDNQQWLNKMWDYIQHFKLKDFDYYDNTIKILDMIILSGNYWTPAAPAGTFTSGNSHNLPRDQGK